MAIALLADQILGDDRLRISMAAALEYCSDGGCGLVLLAKEHQDR